VVVDQEGRILVSDSNNGRVGVLSPEGAPLFSFGRGLGAQSTGLPRGLAVDERNRAYVVDAVSHVVLVFEVQDNGAKQLFTLGSQGSKDGEFSYPNGIALDRAGRLYITDRENNRVQVWTSK
jgi:DNA-binding beta-propeller fold protein YncE